ncbi:uncharacterized protein C8orf74 homolog [Chanos chanos]|uniref:Uncharacterized protein C8orf74 homolog n=1 Tax=Chanos chanos TaxID=29144 RepID=A0A6J2VMG1_CHACN|nr:uncharacterized protein C8orf74 homolog [Chanos chanos]
MASLSATTMREIARLERDAAVLHLSRHFQWKDFEGDDKKHLHQEFVYDNVMYAVKRGVPWAAVVQVAKMTKELLPEVKGLEMSRAVALIRERLSEGKLQLSPGHQTALFNFIVDTYVRHHKLYHAFLHGEVNLKHKEMQLEIHVPSVPLPLVQGTDVQEQERQQALEELMLALSEKQEEICQFKQKAEAQLMAKMQVGLDDLQVDRLSKQAVGKVVREVLQAQGRLIMDTLIKEVNLTHELLELRLKQKLLL